MTAANRLAAIAATPDESPSMLSSMLNELISATIQITERRDGDEPARDRVVRGTRSAASPCVTTHTVATPN